MSQYSVDYIDYMTKEVNARDDAGCAGRTLVLDGAEQGKAAKSRRRPWQAGVASLTDT